MGRFLNFVIACVVVAAIAWGIYGWREKKANRELWIPYHGAASWMVLSLEPGPDVPADSVGNFHGTRILAKAEVRATPTLRKAIADLEQASQQDNLQQAACFNPRHGLRVVKSGVTYDLLICYECHGLAFYADGKPLGVQRPFAQGKATPDDLDRILVEIVSPAPLPQVPATP